MVWRNGDGGELLRFFLAEGERMRGGEEVGGGLILETVQARRMEVHGHGGSRNIH